MEIAEKEVSTLKKVLDELPYNTIDLKRAIADEEIMSISMVHKWYSGSAKVTDIDTINALVKFLNEKYPSSSASPLTLENFIG